MGRPGAAHERTNHMTSPDLTPVTVTCPECGHRQHSVAEHFRDAMIYQCPACSVLLRPEHGDACVLCAHGDGACPLCRRSDQHLEPGTSAIALPEQFL